jgi:hypothetical protein
VQREQLEVERRVERRAGEDRQRVRAAASLAAYTRCSSSTAARREQVGEQLRAALAEHGVDAVLGAQAAHRGAQVGLAQVSHLGRAGRELGGAGRREHDHAVVAGA